VRLIGRTKGGMNTNLHAVTLIKAGKLYMLLVQTWVSLQHQSGSDRSWLKDRWQIRGGS